MPQIFLLVFLPVLGILISDSEKIKPVQKWKTTISEPSDICVNPLNSNYFIVSDRGYLFETNTEFNPIRRTTQKGMDYEGVYADSHFVYAVEERSRRINQFDIQTLALVKSKIIPYSGGRNAGYEGITFNPERNALLLITEKSPIYIIELDKNLDVTNEIKLKEKLFAKPDFIDLAATSNLSFSQSWKQFWGYNGPSDVSAIGYYQGKLFILSDEDSEILQVNPKTYALEKRWRLGILNPEGFFIDKNGVLFILSDNLQKLYRFPSIIS